MAYRILLVEDEVLIRLTLTETLEEAGYAVVAAASGDEACTLIQDCFDVLLTDIHMPGDADGIAVARRFRAQHPIAPIVFMTGRPDVLARIGRLRSTEALLRKPFRPRQILDALQGLLPPLA